MAQKEYVYEPNRYSVTSLLKGVREAILERRHFNEIEVDVSDMIWLLFGRATHHILERQKEENTEFKEEKIETHINDYILSGRFDLYNFEQEKVTDYKTSSVWKIIFKNYDDWRKQLLIYAYILRRLKFPVKEGEIIALLKDHSKMKAKIKDDYPKLPVQRVIFKFNEQDFIDIEAWLYSKFDEIKKAEQLPDDELPLCTPEERYNSGDLYAVMQKNRKKALRVLDSLEDAEKWMKDNKKGDYIQVRLGEDKKCDEYCRVNQFCNYYLNKQKRGKLDGQ